VLTISFNLYLTRPLTTGTLIARGKVVSSSGRLTLAEAVAYDDAGQEVARGSGSFIRSKMKLADALGYSDE